MEAQEIFQKIISLLDSNQADYKLFSHRSALTYEDLAVVQKEAGFFGTEGKCLVLKADDKFIVYVTIQGCKVNFKRISEVVGAKTIRLATAEELKESFAAEPGCAYPFGFAEGIDIYIDPIIYQQEWFLFSPLLSTKTVQVRGADLKQVFGSLLNRVREATDFNLIKDS
ncbi:MAG: YbaK/EbsC family protein [Patescibacteria group bacterium]|jgi:hypothetical protein